MNRLILKVALRFVEHRLYMSSLTCSSRGCLATYAAVIKENIPIDNFVEFLRLDRTRILDLCLQ